MKAKKQIDIDILRNQAAEALDATHAVGERGPRTMNARNRLATWLDLGEGSISQVCSDIRTLRGTESEHITATISQLLKGIRLNRSVPEARAAVRLAIRRTRQLRGILEARAL